MSRVFSLSLCALCLIAGVVVTGCGESTQNTSKSNTSTSSSSKPAKASASTASSSTPKSTASTSSYSASAKSDPAPAPAPTPKPAPAPTPTPTPTAKAERAPAPEADPLAIDPALPDYKPQTKLTGRLRSVGSDTMDKVMEYWGEEFATYHNIRLFHEGKGSSSAPPALSEGLSDVGPMSRSIKETEITLINQKFGYNPTQLITAIDALAVYVHPTNPLVQRGVTLPELDAIYSSTRKLGYPRDAKTWGDIGLTGNWGSRPIEVYSRNKVSGTYGYFNKVALGKGDYKTTNREMVGSAQVVAGVEASPYAIGYSGIGYKTPGVAVVPIAKGPGQPAYLPEPKHAYSGDYPIARPLFITIVNKPGTPLSDLHREFIRYVFSKQGQEQIKRDGFFPIDAGVAREELRKVGITPDF